MTGMTPDSLQDVVDKLGTSCLKRNRSFDSSVDESSYMGKKLKPNDTLSSTSSFESNKSSKEDSEADMETDMDSKPSPPRNQSSNSNHNPTPPLPTLNPNLVPLLRRHHQNMCQLLWKPLTGHLTFKIVRLRIDRKIRALNALRP